MSNSGIFFVISAPSGTGKSTVIDLLLKELPSLKKPVSFTTRDPRPGEKDHVDYNFISKQEFKAKMDKGDFIEWATVYDNFYATSLDYINKELEKGSIMIKDIDTQGALQLKKVLGKKVVLIFIEPPSLQELENRIRARNKDNKAVIQTRMNAAMNEMAEASKYDHRVINDRIENAVLEIKKIIDGHKK